MKKVDIVGHQSKTTRHFFCWGSLKIYPTICIKCFVPSNLTLSLILDLQKTKEVQGNLPWYRKKKIPPPFKKSKNFFLSKSLPPRTFLCEKKRWNQARIPPQHFPRKVAINCICPTKAKRQLNFSGDLVHQQFRGTVATLWFGRFWGS